MTSQKESSTKYKTISVGNQEEYSFITTNVCDASYGHSVTTHFHRCIEELFDRVSKLEELVDSKTIIIDSCDEMYAEEWRET